MNRLGFASGIAIDTNDPDACIIADTFHLWRGGSGFNGLQLLNEKIIANFHWNDIGADAVPEGTGDASRILPGDGIVSPVALYPGTALYEREKAEGRIDDSVWFRRPDSGIFMRNDEQAARFVHDLLNELSMIRERSWYRRADFARHRKATGGDCWVTDILEGDYYLDEEDYPSAELCYLRVIKKTPDNPWGYLRMGKLKFRTSDFPGAVEHYTAVTQAAPAYYGGWLKLAESRIAVGDRASARKCLARAHSLNRFDRRIANLMALVQ